jgi:hypothetical protein
MPKLTRVEQFTRSFGEFMNSKFSNINDWTLNPKEKYKNQSCHMYDFKIPENYDMFYMDISRRDENGVQIRETVPHYDIQILPANNDFKQIFKEHFSPSYLKQQRKIVSYSIIKSITIDEYNDNRYFIATIEVRFYKENLPFPYKKSLDELSIDEMRLKYKKIEKENRDLLLQLDSVEKDFADLSEKNLNIKKILETKKNHIEKLTTKIIQKYKEFEECPVCYEIMKPEKLKVPVCCHFICSDCEEKCNSCPLCREDYLHKICDENVVDNAINENEDEEVGFDWEMWDRGYH